MPTIKQTVTFNASPKKIYDMLMDSKQHATFTEAAAKINPTIGGKFSAYDGYIEGKNLRLVPGKKIVQLWRGSDWPKGQFSTATFELKKHGIGTTLTFTHTDVPKEFMKDIAQGWKDYYWKRMKQHI